MTRNIAGISWKDVILHSAAGIFIALVLWYGGLLTRFEADTFDLRVRLYSDPTTANRSITLVGLDQLSLDWVAENLGVTWPWPRQLFADIITNCKRRGAKVIGFDVILSDLSPAGVLDDRYFSEAIKETGNFALGSVQPTNMKQGLKLMKDWPKEIPRPAIEFMVTEKGLRKLPMYTHASFPVPEIGTQATVLCNVQHQPDNNDGIYRKMPPFVMFDGEPLPTLGIGMYLASHPGASVLFDEKQIVIDDIIVPIDEEGNTLLNYRGPSFSYQYISALELIQSEFKLANGEIDPEDIPKNMQEKYVLFGYTAPGLSDSKISPLGVLSGPEINATFLDNFLSNDFIYQLPFYWTLAAVLALTFISTLFVSFLKTFRYQALFSILFFLFPAVIALMTYRAGYNFTYLPVQIAVTSGIVISLFRAYFIVQGQEKFIRHSFKHYLSPVVIDQLIHNPDRLKLGGERKELSLLFADLEGFTKISEGLEPEDLTQLLNEYLTAMTDIILEEEGTVDKFEGDAIIAFWNAPLDIEKHAEKAVRAALRCQDKLKELRPHFLDKYGKRLNMRIGINTGYAIAGNMGSSSRFDYTVLGDAVNLAARLEGANKHYGTYTMISSATFEQLGENFQCRELGKIRVVGRSESVTVYEPLSYEKTVVVDQDFDRGREFFYQGEFNKALEAFSRRENDDPAASAYCEKCRELIGKELVDWTGVWELDSK